MGKRKAISQAQLRDAKKDLTWAILRNCPISPRKTRLVADMIRGMEVNKALAVLRYSPQGSTPYLERLLVSALANWNQKHPDTSADEHMLCISKITVDGGPTMKRVRARAQGRMFRILKRSCHVYLEVAEMPEVKHYEWRQHRKKNLENKEVSNKVQPVNS